MRVQFKNKFVVYVSCERLCPSHAKIHELAKGAVERKCPRNRTLRPEKAEPAFLRPRRLVPTACKF